MLKLIAILAVLSLPTYGQFFGSSNAKRIQSVAVKSSLGCTDGQVLSYVAANTQFECTTTSGTGDVGGGTNLATVGAIPYVSASGVLSQDSPALHWDATNNRLGLGTASPAVQQHLINANGSGSPQGIRIESSSTGAVGVQMGNSTTGATDLWQFFLSSDAGKFKIGRANVADFLTMTSAGSIGFGPSNTSPTGTLHVYDATATTGDTILNIRDGQLAPARINFAPNGSATPDLGLRHSSANNLAITNGSSTTYWTLGAGGIVAGTGGSAIVDEASNALAVRNSTNAQTLRLYNTYTDASNYRRLIIDNAAGVSRIYTSHAGTGTAYPLDLGVSNAVQWRIDTDGAIRPITDNTYDLGNSSGKVRDIYAARDFIGASTSCIYLGATGTDNSWRWCRSGNNSVMERRESGSWVTKQTITP